MHLRVYIPDVLSDDAHEKQLQRAQEEHADRDRCYAHREIPPKQKFVCEVGCAAKHGDQCPSKSCKSHQPQRNFGKLGNPEHCEIVKRIKVVLRFTALTALLFIKYFGMRKADLSDHSAEIRVWIAKLTNQIDNLPIIQSKAGKVFIGLNVVGQPVNEPIKQFSNHKHRCRFVAFIFHGNDDRYSFLPLLE